MSLVVCPLEFGSARIDGKIRAFLIASSAARYSVLSGPNVAGCSFCKRLFSGAGSRAKLETKRRKPLHKPRNDRSFVNSERPLSVRVASVVCDANSDRRGRMMCPR